MATAMEGGEGLEGSNVDKLGKDDGGQSEEAKKKRKKQKGGDKKRIQGARTRPPGGVEGT